MFARMIAHSSGIDNVKKFALLLIALCAGCGGGGGGAAALPSIATNGAGGAGGARLPGGVPSATPSANPTSVPTTAPTPQPFLSGPHYWIIQGAAAAAMAADPVAQPYFATGNHTMLIPATQLAPANWRSTAMVTFTSFAQFQSAVASNTVNARVKTVLYDNEVWSYTPPNEQADPVGYTAQFVQLAHSHGWSVIATHAGAAGSSDSLTTDAGMCRYADSFSIQSQGIETNVAAFQNVVATTVSACRAANPNVRVFAGVSTGPTGQVVTAQQIASAVMSVANVVDGYWLNIPQNSSYCPKCTQFDPALASAALALLPSPGP